MSGNYLDPEIIALAERLFEGEERQEELASKNDALLKQVSALTEHIKALSEKVERTTEENRQISIAMGRQQSDNEAIITPAVEQMKETVSRLENLGDTIDMSKIKDMVMETTREAIDEFFKKDILETKGFNTAWMMEQIRSRNNLLNTHESMTEELRLYANRYMEQVDKAKEYMSKTLAQDMSLQQAMAAINAVVNHTEQTRNHYELNQKQYALDTARYQVLLEIRKRLFDDKYDPIPDRKEREERIYRLIDRHIVDYLSRGGYKKFAEELAEIDERIAELAKEDEAALEELHQKNPKQRPNVTDEEYADHKRHERAITLLGEKLPFSLLKKKKKENPEQK